MDVKEVSSHMNSLGGGNSIQIYDQLRPKMSDNNTSFKIVVTPCNIQKTEPRAQGIRQSVKTVRHAPMFKGISTVLKTSTNKYVNKS
jgi:hypothetical protein